MYILETKLGDEWYPVIDMKETKASSVTRLFETEEEAINFADKFLKLESDNYRVIENVETD